jgi:hypothetical protein
VDDEEGRDGPAGALGGKAFLFYYLLIFFWGGGERGKEERREEVEAERAEEEEEGIKERNTSISFSPLTAP